MQRLIKSGGLGAVLVAGFVMAAAAQTPPPTYYQTVPPPPPPYATQDQSAAFPYGGVAAPAPIAPAPYDVWHQLNDERSRQEQRTNIGGGG